jgi:very-short-patch-repair endonuclease
MTWTLGDQLRQTNSPPLQGRGRGWGLTANELAELKRRADDMRRNLTEPEKRLWGILSNSQLGGFKFRRQQVIYRYIADFTCPSAHLIVEVDGDTHDDAKDRVRDEVLSDFGWRVLRVTNLDVMSNLEGVARAISIALASDIARVDRPHPNPSPEGEGLKEAQKLLGISLESNVG